jgi:hypothetical protein
VGPASSVSDNIVLFDGTTGKLIKDSTVALSALPTLSANNTMTGQNRMTYDQLRQTCTNEGTTGTTVNRAAKLTTTTCQVATAATDVPFGIVTSVAGTTSNAVIVRRGKATCDFTGAATAGDWVTVTTGGQCATAGTTKPTTGYILGRVVTTIGGAGATDVWVDPEQGIPAGGGTNLLVTSLEDSDCPSKTTLGYGTMCSVTTAQNVNYGFRMPTAGVTTITVNLSFAVDGTAGSTVTTTSGAGPAYRATREMTFTVTMPSSCATYGFLRIAPTATTTLFYTPRLSY